MALIEILKPETAQGFSNRVVIGLTICFVVGSLALVWATISALLKSGHPLLALLIAIPLGTGLGHCSASAIRYCRPGWFKTAPADAAEEAEKLSATQLARARNEPVVEIQRKLIALGYIEVKSGLHYFTDLGRSVGGEIRKNHPEAREGHMVWPANINL